MRQFGLELVEARFAEADGMSGDYFGYDGPGPPWNDERLHHYVFTLYALDSARCAVEGRFGGPEVLTALEGHVERTFCAMCGAVTLLPWMLYCIIVLILGFEDTLSLSDAVGEKYADPSARIACQGLWQASLWLSATCLTVVWFMCLAV